MSYLPSCRVCGKPTSLSVRRDPFGKTDQWDHYCPKHAPHSLALAPRYSGETLEQMASDNIERYLTELKPYQSFWCCEHHRSSIDNFFLKRTACEWSCQKQGLRWHDHGKRQMPKSWGTPQTATGFY